MPKDSGFRGDQILVLTVNLGGGRKVNINVFEFDEAFELASKFAKELNLKPEVERALENHIQKKIDEYYIEQEQEKVLAEYKPQMSQVNETPENNKKVNFGHVLYEKCMKDQEKAQMQRHMLKLKLEEEKSKDLTFKPHIKPKKLKSSQSCTSIKNWQKKRQEEIDKLRGEVMAQQQKECTFKPETNSNSSRIQSRKFNNKDKFTQLYEDARIRKLKQEKVQRNFVKSQYSFTPKITESGYHRDPEELIERLISFKEEIEKNLQEERKKVSELVDPNTGKAYFKPSTGREPKSKRNFSGLPIGEYLYQLNQKPKSKLMEDQQSSQSRNLRSEKIMQKLKISRYFEIFQSLNPDKDGNITAEEIYPENLDEEILRIIYPLLEELAQIGEPLNFEEFCDSMDNLLKTLTPGEKSSLLGIRKKQTEGSEISSSNRSIPLNEGSAVYDRHMIKELQKEAKIQHLQREKEMQEVEGCTFRPQTTRYRPKKSFEDNFLAQL